MLDQFFWIIGFSLSAFAMADLITGIIHWFEDRYARKEWPLIGKWIAEPNEIHHSDPRQFLNGSYLFRNSTTIIPCALICTILINFELWWCFLVMIFSSQANEIHASAHRAKNWKIVKLAQEMGLIQGHRHHAAHHISPFATHYCVMTPWLNPILDRIKFWRLLEFLFTFTTRIKVK